MPPQRNKQMDDNQDNRRFYTDAGVSDGDAQDGGEFLSDMEYDEGDQFYEALGAIIEGKDIEDFHTPDLTTDPENQERDR
jgi:hypothetical protein